MQSVAIIGAGPAGSIAAICLARAGVPVTIIEQHRFPRDKVCGECLSAMGIEVLERLELIAPLMRHGPVRLERGILFAIDGTTAHVPLPRRMLGISRLVLDQFLLDAARGSGVTIFQPARLEHDNRLRDLQTNRVERLTANYVLSADGKSAQTTRDLGLKAHFSQVDAPRDAIELFGVRGHYGGIAPIEGGLWNIAFSVPQERVRKCRGDLDELFAAISGENAALQSQMRPARRVSDWLVSPLSRFRVRREWPDGTIPIGNAAAAIEPIGGEGMGLAMRSAELAADCLIDAIRNGAEPDLERLRAAYRELWRLRGLACRAAALAVSSPWLCRAILPFIDSEDAITGLALQALGKA